MLRSLVHLACLANFAYAIYFDLYMVKIPGREKLFGGQWKYLTYINMWIQLIYFSVSLLNNFIGTESTTASTSSTLQRIRDFLFASLAFPIGQFVGIIFWTLFAIDRNLVFPASLDKHIPPPINHMMHTTVIPAQLFELLSTYHVYPARRFGLTAAMAACLAYIGWIHIVAYYGKIWVYPILEVLGNGPRAGFIAICCIFGGLLYLFAEQLHFIAWSKIAEASTESSDENRAASKAKTRGRPRKKAVKAE